MSLQLRCMCPRRTGGACCDSSCCSRPSAPHDAAAIALSNRPALLCMPSLSITATSSFVGSVSTVVPRDSYYASR